VHCDLKPANILVAGNDRALVTDFGFACLLRSTQRTPHSIGGTAGFLAPELQRPGALPTPAADVYSLGILLQQILKRSIDSPPLEQFASLERILHRALADEPLQRYANATELLRELSVQA